MRSTWELGPVDAQTSREIQGGCGVSRALADVLVSRGIDSAVRACEFLNPDLTDLPDPGLLPGAGEGVQRVRQSLAGGEAIAVYGHDDADGVTATAIMHEALGQLGARVLYYIPDRESEGHGMNKRALEALAELGVGLTVTVDCCVSDAKCIDYALSLGMDTIVTDHHEIPARLPAARAIVNPKLPDSRYPYRYLAGAGVSLRFAELLLRELGDDFGVTGGPHWAGPSWRDEAVSLAAIGSIIDKVPLTGDNRTIVAVGLRKISLTERPGLRALLESSGLWGRNLSVPEVRDSLGPLFGSGSDGSGVNAALEILLMGDVLRVSQMTDVLHRSKVKWRSMALSAVRRVRRELAEKGGARGAPVIVARVGVPITVMGYVTSRLAGEHELPVVLIVDKDGEAMAEARGPKGFNLVHAFDSMADLFLGYGGHPRAAGFSIPKEHVDTFEARMREYAIANPPAPVPRRIDAALPITEATLDMAQDLERLAPFGHANPRAALLSSGTTAADIAEARESGLQFTTPPKLDEDHTDMIYRLTARDGRAVATVVDPSPHSRDSD